MKAKEEGGRPIADALADLWGGSAWKPEWSKFNVPPGVLEKLRNVGDGPADDLLADLDLESGRDILDLIEEAATNGTSDAAKQFWQSVQSAPAWIDWEIVGRAQEDVFWQFAGPMLMLLLHFSLIVGVSAPKVNRVLVSTGYLTKPGERTFKRLLETTAWLAAIMEPDALRPMGSGWKACLRVRFLHAHVRLRLRKLAQKRPDLYDEASFGVPINQEDMAATILAFSVGPIAGLQRMGLAVSATQREDYCHLWRYVAWLMGVQDVCNPCNSFPKASAWAMSIVRHISQPDESSRLITDALLKSCAAAAYAREPKYSEDAWLGFLHELTRIVVGDEYAVAVGVPLRTDFWTSWSAWLLCKYYVVSAGYLSYYSSRWRTWRVERAKRYIPKMLAEMLNGMPRFLLEHSPAARNLSS
ncbi:hypothetical protein DFJ74DRAFT_668950 [Hyaloraphidium curvatum]|nr:hypothetical protein DFJ74DRAFT_668950 [Hyaloraphidium curvatum]